MEESLRTAEAYLKQGKYREARSICSELVRSNSIPRARYLLALAEFLDSDYTAAEAEVRTYVKSAPDSAEAHGLLGATLAQSDRLAEAEAALKRSLELSPSQPQVLKHLGALYLRKQLYTSAGETLAQALRLQPGDAETAFALALARYGSHDFAGTVEAAQAATSLRPDDPEALLLLGQALMDLHQYDNAEWTLRRALRSNPAQKPNDKPYYTLGNLLLVLDRQDEALKLFDEGARINPRSVPSLLGRARILMDRDEPEKARPDAEAAVAAEPNSETAHALLLKIYLALGMERKADTEARWLDARNSERLKGARRQP